VGKRLWPGLLVLGALWGCVAVKPIMTPQEYRADCRRTVACPDADGAAAICAGFQETVTDYYDGMAPCRQACKDKAEALAATVPGVCRASIDTARAACLEFCNRKFYRCNCDKADALEGGNGRTGTRPRP